MLFQGYEVYMNTKLNEMFSSSVNSKLFTARKEGVNYVVKISQLHDKQSCLYFYNKLHIYKKLHDISRHDFFVLKHFVLAVDGGILSDVYSELNVPFINNILRMFNSQPGIDYGFIIEPLLEEYVDFEVYCIKNPNENNVIFIFNKLAEILYHMYERYKFNHNDLHCRNFMVSTTHGYVKLIDYDWATFNDNQYYPEQESMMTTLYFTPLHSVIQYYNCYNFESCVGKINEWTKANVCDLLHYYIHLLYSYKYYLNRKPSPSVDLAKLCIDFSKKFFGEGNCSEYNTEFIGNTLKIRSIYQRYDSLIHVLQRYKNNDYELDTATTPPQSMNSGGGTTYPIKSKDKYKGESVYVGKRGGKYILKNGQYRHIPK